MSEFIRIEPPGLEPLVLGSPSEIQVWVGQQIAGWNQLRELASSRGAGEPTGTICTTAINSLTELQTIVANQLRGGSFGTPKVVEDKIRHDFATSWLPFNARDVGLVTFALENYSGQTGGRILEYLFRAKGRPRVEFWDKTAGSVIAVLHNQMILKRADYQPLDELRKDWEAEHGERRSEFTKWRDEAMAQADKVRAQYMQIKTLDEPANYWGSKQRTHLITAWVFGAMFLAAGVLGVWLLVLRLDSSRAEMLATLKTQLATSTQGVQALYLIPHMLPTLLLAIGLLWGLRMLTRLFLVQVHLHADAAERVVMVKTYLSLLVGKGVLDGKAAVGEENLTVILSQLFRHESTGVFPDDSAPALPVAEVLKVAFPTKEK